ncbi:hypothetical protein E2C01_029965 [Portunus trituberculatus]|uniref:Uncharacterized protein n=1 Tax=Portunus trituberculatus TaxID=210409 RepID=A0A5B7ESX9_PORTR|nr:hypothetical protein [Portunus trituberculatus]
MALTTNKTRTHRSSSIYLNCKTFKQDISRFYRSTNEEEITVLPHVRYRENKGPENHVLVMAGGAGGRELLGGGGTPLVGGRRGRQASRQWRQQARADNNLKVLYAS